MLCDGGTAVVDAINFPGVVPPGGHHERLPHAGTRRLGQSHWTPASRTQSRWWTKCRTESSLVCLRVFDHLPQEVGHARPVALEVAAPPAAPAAVRPRWKGPHRHEPCCGNAAGCSDLRRAVCACTPLDSRCYRWRNLPRRTDSGRHADHRSPTGDIRMNSRYRARPDSDAVESLHRVGRGGKDDVSCVEATVAAQQELGCAWVECRARFFVEGAWNGVFEDGRAEANWRWAVLHSKILMISGPNSECARSSRAPLRERRSQRAL